MHTPGGVLCEIVGQRRRVGLGPAAVVVAIGRLDKAFAVA